MYFQRSHGQGSTGSLLILLLTALTTFSCSGSGSDGINDTGNPGSAGSTGGSVNPGSGGRTATGGSKGTGGSTGVVAVTQSFCNLATPSRAAQCSSLSGTAESDYCCMVWSAVDACRAAGQAVQTPNPMSCCVSEYYLDTYNFYKVSASSLAALGKLPTIATWDDVTVILGDSSKVYSLCVTLFSYGVIGGANDGKNGLGETPATT
jgi:hypothetical protein